MIAATGWTWEQVGNLTLHRYYALCEYWRDHPPLHIMVAAYLGIKSESRKESETSGEMSKEQVAELFALMGKPVPEL